MQLCTPPRGSEGQGFKLPCTKLSEGPFQLSYSAEIPQASHAQYFTHPGYDVKQRLEKRTAVCF